MNQIPPYDALSLLQSQAEVHGLQRTPPKSSDDLLRAKNTVNDLCKFINQISRLATKQGFPLELVFQCLLGISIGGEVNFDKQARQGDVPMHQAKVLNREAANSIAPKLRAEVPADELDGLVRRSTVMRTFLRIKVEDGNDLSMARRALTLGDEYFRQIDALSGGNPAVMWAIYTADDPASINRIVRGTAGGDADANGDAGDVAAPGLKAMPKHLPHGIHAECSAFLMTNTEAVAKRQTALANILAWLKEAPAAQVRSELTEIVMAMRRALDVQLAEKRSALTRAACDIVSTIALIATPSHFAVPEVKDVMASWVGVLLKQVHVTVSAIAEATDGTVRDVVVASAGAAFLWAAVAAVLSKATQPELQRKCVGYLLIGLVASHAELGSKLPLALPVVDAALRSSNDGIRRVARAFAIVCETKCPSVRLPSWDSRCEKSATDERPVVLNLLDKGLANFEVGVLRYSSPCSAASALLSGGSNETSPVSSAKAATVPQGPLPALARPARVSTPASVAPTSTVVQEGSPTNLPSAAQPRSQPRPVAQSEANALHDRYHGGCGLQSESAVSPIHPVASRSAAAAGGGPAQRPGSGVPLSLAGLQPAGGLSAPTASGSRTSTDLLSSLKSRRRIQDPLSPSH